jgi:hypothetical protein
MLRAIALALRERRRRGGQLAPDLARLVPVTEHKRGFAINADLYEAERTKYLSSCGIWILRFENKGLLREAIKAA